MMVYDILNDNSLCPGLFSAEPNRPLTYGDLFILYAGYDCIYLYQLTKNGICNLKYGHFRHDDLVGKRYGTKIYDDQTKRWIALLRPTAEFFTLTTPHRTQILYQADISLIIMLLNAVPNKRIVESGTGSGSLSCSIARAIAPKGQLFTFEVHDERFEKAKTEFKKFDLNFLITIAKRDIYSEGFPSELHGTIDGVFLDLPTPWLAVSHAKNILKVGGILVSFSPCIEQVQNMCETLDSQSFNGIRTFEVLTKPMGINVEQDQMPIMNPSKKVKSDEVKPVILHDDRNNHKKETLANIQSKHWYTQFQLPMKSHSGYLTVSRKCLDTFLE